MESERCPSFTAATKAGKPVKIDVNQAMTLADGKLYRNISFGIFGNCLSHEFAA